MKKENGDDTFTLETLPAADELFPIEIISTQADNFYVDDLLFRILTDPTIKEPMVLCLQVVEPLGTFGAASLIYSKYRCTYYQETLPPEMLDTVAMLAKRRGMLGW